MPATGALIGTPGVHEGERGAAHGGLRGGAVRAEHLGDEAVGIGELLHGGDDRQQGALCQRAVADLAAAGAAARLRLTHGVGGEVVLVHVALELLLVDAVEHLLVAHRAERGDGEHLRLPAGEEAGAVGARQQADFRGQRAHLVHAAAVHALLIVEQPAAHDVFLRLVEALVDLGLLVGVKLGKVLVHFFIDGLEALVAHVLVVRVERGLDVLERVGAHGVLHLVAGVHGRIRELRLADLRLDLLDEGDDLLVRLVAGHDALIHLLVGDDVGPGLDHGDARVRGGHRHGHAAHGALGGGGVDHIGAVHQADGDAGDRAVPRDVGDRERHTHAHHAGDLGRAVVVHAHHGAHHRNVVAHVLREQRADRAVDHAAGEDRLVRRAALTLEEGAGDFAHGVELLLEIDGEGEEVDALARFGGSRNRHVHDRLAVADEAGAVGQAGHLAGFNHERPAGEVCFKRAEIFKHWGILLFFLR